MRESNKSALWKGNTCKPTEHSRSRRGTRARQHHPAGQAYIVLVKLDCFRLTHPPSCTPKRIQLIKPISYHDRVPFSSDPLTEALRER
jgi:hypothetical protein